MPKSKIVQLVAAAIGLLVLAHGAAAATTLDDEFVPPQGKGPAVLLISGAGGPNEHMPFAEDLSRQGYFVALLDARKYNIVKSSLAVKLVGDAVRETHASPHALGARIAVIGFSKGGGAALAIASGMAAQVESVVAYYPTTGWSTDFMSGVVGAMKVPTLFFAGGEDTWLNCCTIANARKFEGLAKQAGAPFDFVVYPEAGHNFVIRGGGGYYRDDAARDAFARTLAHLRRNHGD